MFLSYVAQPVLVEELTLCPHTGGFSLLTARLGPHLGLCPFLENTNALASVCQDFP